MVRRIIHEMDFQTSLVGKRCHAVDKPRPSGMHVGFLRVAKNNHGKPRHDFQNAYRLELCFGVHIMVVRLRRINATRFHFPGKIADGDLGLDVDRNPQGLGGWHRLLC